MIITDQIRKGAREHARAEYPREACGLVVNDFYIACRNVAEDPENDFAIHPQDQLRAMKRGKIQMVIHSHPNGPLTPTQADMIGQMKMGVPWAIVPLDEDRIGDLVIWGDDEVIPPLIGRPFVHGVTDCYSVVRDAYRLGKDKLAEQGIEWPLDPIDIGEVPRGDQWWAEGQDLYSKFRDFGFRPIDFSEIRPGDAFLIKVHSKVLNHAGVLIGNGLIVQHFPNRLSSRVPAGLWARNADVWLRHESSNA
jgi:proteasome lid subunit RPN8/RPN11